MNGQDLLGGGAVAAPAASADPLRQESTQKLAQILSAITANRKQLPQMVPTTSLQDMERQQPNRQIAHTQDEGTQLFFQNLGVAVQNAVAAHKEKQTREAMGTWMALQQAYERSQMTGQPLDQDPIAQAILSDPKKMKQLAKVYSTDLLNPEKTTVWHEAAKRAAQADKAGKMVKLLRALHLAHQRQVQLNPQEQQQMGKEMAGRVSAMGTPQQLDPKTAIAALTAMGRTEYEQNRIDTEWGKLDEKAKEFDKRLEQTKAESARKESDFQQLMSFRQASANQRDQTTRDIAELKVKAMAARQAASKASPDKKLPPGILKYYSDYQDAETRYNVMQQNLIDGMAGSQQAMLSLLANHIGMTMGQIKGIRSGRQLIMEAESSAPALGRIEAKFSDEGYLQGVVLTPTQMQQMVDLAQQREVQELRKFNEMAAYAGAPPATPSTRAPATKPSGKTPPAGATMKVPGSDGKMHWSDGKRDLGVVQ